MIKALTYDDIQLIPQYSEVMSRSNVSLETNVTKNFKIQVPIVGSPMDTVCGLKMGKKLMKMGGVGCIHRFMPTSEQSRIVKNLTLERDLLINGDELSDVPTLSGDLPIMAAVGVGNSELSRASLLIDAGVDIILIDVAHGHHKNVKEMIGSLKSIIKGKGKKVDIIAGNVATYDGAMDLCKWGVDGVRVGVGGGCFTPDMEVRTNNGLKKIKNIEIGDEVYTHTGELKPVMDKFEYDDYDEVYDIDGIEATGNHKFYVVHESKVDLVNDENIHDYAEWVKAEDLTNEYLLIEL